MSERLLAGSTYKNAWLILPLVLGGMAVGCELAFQAQGVLYVAAAFCFLAGLLAWGVLFSRRRWLQIEAEGFSVDGPGIQETWRDVQIERLSWWVAKNYSNGIAKTETCRLEVWNGQGRRIKLLHTKPLETSTPFMDFATRIFESLRKRSREALERGARVEGEGWTLDREKLTWKGGELKLTEASGAGEYDGQVRVWKKGSNDAVYGIPAQTANAVLMKVLIEELRPKEEGTARVESGDDLGKVLFERPGGSVWTYHLLGASLVLVGGLVFVANVGWGLGVIGAAGACVAWGWWLGGLMFRCHEWGVSRRTRRGTTTIRYRDISEFTSKATRHFVNGAYTGTTLSMEFRSRPELGGERIVWTASLRGMDDEMDNLRNHISKVIAARWIELLKHGETLPWTENLRLLPDGVEYRPTAMFGRKDWKKADYGEIAGQKMEQGVFYLFLKGEQKPATQESVAATNFFPGFYVLMLVLQSS